MNEKKESGKKLYFFSKILLVGNEIFAGIKAIINFI